MIKYYSLILFIFVGFATVCFAQPAITPRIAGISGAGTAVSSGIAASFTNPANLMIKDHQQSYLIYTPQLSYFYSDGFSGGKKLNDYLNYARPFQSYNLDWESESFFTESNEYFENLYRNNQDVSNTLASFDGLIFGLSVTKPGLSWSIAYRIRGENNWKLGKGWYSNELGLAEPSGNFTLSQSFHFYHEFAVGLAWEYELISGWLTDLSKLFIGINPKLLAGGMYFEHSLNGQYSINEGQWSYSGDFQSRSAGSATNLIQQVRNGIDPNLAARDIIHNRSIPEITGYGGGVDAGVTYIMGLGNELSLGTNRDDPTLRSIRFSAAVTDLGIISYNNNQFRLSNSTSYSNVAIPGSINREYSGSPGQYFTFLNNVPEHMDLLTSSIEGEDIPIRIQLPTKFSAGTAIQLNRLLISADMQMPLSNESYFGNTNSWYFGTEIKLLRLLPLRGGIKMQNGQPVYYSAGFGIDFRNFDFSTATQFRIDNKSPSINPVSVSVISLHIRL